MTQEFLLNILLTGKDLFNENWTTGNLYALGGWTEKIGNVACVVISFVGFGIVIFSIIKNALSGLYVVNPNFWDKVDEVKTAMIGADGNGQGYINSAISGVAGKGGNQVGQQLGGALTYLLSMVPNVKALTDFDGSDGTIDKKQYFARSIPLLVAQIFIGMLIFFGYPSKIANWIGSAGTQVLDMLIDNTDPVAIVTNLSGKFISAQFMYESSDDLYEKQVYNASKEAWTAIVGHLTDIEKNPRQEVAYAVESWVYSKFAPYSSTIGAPDGFNVSSSVTYTTTTPVAPASMAQSGDGVYVSTAANGTVSYRAWIDVLSFTRDTGTTMRGDQDYIVVTYTCTPKAVSSTTTVSGIVHMRRGTMFKSSAGYIIPLESAFGYSESSANNCIVGTPISVTVEMYNGENLTTSAAGSLQVSGGKLQLLIPKGVDEAILGSSGRWVLNFGFNTSSLKYVAIEGTTKIEVPITAFEVNSNLYGLQLSNMNSTEAYDNSTKVINALKSGNVGNSANTGTTQQ